MAPLAVGSTFAGKFRVLGTLGEGGMGTVYLVEQLSTHKTRALKLMRGALGYDPEAGERFAREARVGARIASDHVVEVVDAVPWLAMEHLEGETLADRIARGGMDPGALREVMRQLGHGLGAAHRAGLVHRDLKPENIFLASPRREGVALTVKILDFGLAKLVEETAGGTGTYGLGERATGACGTPLWMAPEQLDAGVVSAAADVWALGLIAYLALTGTHYWRSARAPDLSVQRVLGEMTIEPLEPASVRAGELGRGGWLPPGFDEWFARCVDREPPARFPDAERAVKAFLALGGAHVVGAAPAAQLDAIASAPTLAATPADTPRLVRPRRAWRRVGVALALAGLVLGGGAAGAIGWAMSAPAAPGPTTASAPADPVAPEPAPVFALPDEAACEAGDNAACARAGVHYTRGEGVERDYARAMALYRRACDARVARGCTDLGYAHEVGWGIEADLDAATRLYTQACDLRDPAGCTLLGWRYYQGRGAPLDPARALSLFEGACAGDDAAGCNQLGNMLRDGIATPADVVRAREVYGRSCDGGDGIGCANLAGLVDDGIGGPEDDARARQLSERSCELDYARGCSDLGEMVREGVGGPRDPARARALFERACEIREAYGCANLGDMYRDGDGLERDPVRANALFSQACGNGLQWACDQRAD